jgi:hypothetical protein
MDSQPVTTTTVGMLPRRSNKMCGLTADVLRRNWARGKAISKRSMAVVSSA